jgi:hypothetical protein
VPELRSAMDFPTRQFFDPAFTDQLRRRRETEMRHWATERRIKDQREIARLRRALERERRLVEATREKYLQIKLRVVMNNVPAARPIALGRRGDPFGAFVSGALSRNPAHP